MRRRRGFDVDADDDSVVVVVAVAVVVSSGVKLALLVDRLDLVRFVPELLNDGPGDDGVGVDAVVVVVRCVRREHLPMDSPEFLHQLIVSIVLHHPGGQRPVGLDDVRLDDVRLDDDAPGLGGVLVGGLALPALDLILQVQSLLFVVPPSLPES